MGGQYPSTHFAIYPSKHLHKDYSSQIWFNDNIKCYCHMRHTLVNGLKWGKMTFLLAQKICNWEYLINGGCSINGSDGFCQK